MVQGFSQVPKIDFTEIFALAIKWKSLKIFFALAILFSLVLMQIDIIGVYLKSALRQNK